MSDELTREDALLGGPGLDGYAFEGDVFCPSCAADIIDDIFDQRDDEPIPFPEAEDSEELPQPIFFGEADYAVHCAACGEYLYGEDEDEAEDEDEDEDEAEAEDE